MNQIKAPILHVGAKHLLHVISYRQLVSRLKAAQGSGDRFTRKDFWKITLSKSFLSFGYDGAFVKTALDMLVCSVWHSLLVQLKKWCNGKLLSVA